MPTVRLRRSTAKICIPEIPSDYCTIYQLFYRTTKNFLL